MHDSATGNSHGNSSINFGILNISHDGISVKLHLVSFKRDGRYEIRTMPEQNFRNIFFKENKRQCLGEDLRRILQKL